MMPRSNSINYSSIHAGKHLTHSLSPPLGYCPDSYSKMHTPHTNPHCLPVRYKPIKSASQALSQSRTVSPSLTLSTTSQACAHTDVEEKNSFSTHSAHHALVFPQGTYTGIFTQTTRFSTWHTGISSPRAIFAAQPSTLQYLQATGSLKAQTSHNRPNLL